MRQLADDRNALISGPMTSSTPSSAFAPSLFLIVSLYGGLVVLAGVLGAKLADLGTWTVVGPMMVECGLVAFLMLVVLSSATAELHGEAVARKLVRMGFVPLIVSMVLIRVVIDLVPPAPAFAHQAEFALILGQGSRMQAAGLVSYGLSQSLNVLLFARLGRGSGTGQSAMGLFQRAWIAGLASQSLDTIVFMTLSFWGVAGSDGHALPLGAMIVSQLAAKLTLSALLVPPLIWLTVRLGRWMDRGTPAHS